MPDDTFNTWQTSRFHFDSTFRLSTPGNTPDMLSWMNYEMFPRKSNMVQWVSHLGL